MKLNFEPAGASAQKPPKRAEGTPQRSVPTWRESFVIVLSRFFTVPVRLSARNTSPQRQPCPTKVSTPARPSVFLVWNPKANAFDPIGLYRS